MKIVVTGCAGFIGSHVSEYLLKRGDEVMGIDNLNNYYDVSIKEKNVDILKQYSNFQFYKEDICETKKISEWKPDKICHLASMAGVRYSLQNPKLYVKVNIEGFVHILQECLLAGSIKQIVYASSSSVYGLNKKIPFSESDKISTCNSPYASSKMAMELFAKTYHQLYGIKSIGLRFFTVYGPRGRPDMAPYKFLKAIMNGDYFQKYGEGNSMRDYTYIDDIVSGVISSIDNKKQVECEIYNLGNSSPITLNKFIENCEEVVGKKAKYHQIGNQLGDVPKTFSDITKAYRDLEYFPKVSIKTGLRKTYEYLKKM